MRTTSKFFWPLAVLTVLSLTVAVAGVALADAATDQDITILGTDGGTNDYINTTSATVRVAVNHCPPGGDMAALEVAFRNDPADAWTVVHAAATAWPGTDPDGCTSGVPTAPYTDFSWTLASGADGSRTVHARFTHSINTVLDDDSIVLDTTAPVITEQGVVSGTPGDNGWYTTDVTNQFQASDALSGLSTTCQTTFSGAGVTRDVTSTGEGSNVAVSSGPCSDVAGNTNPGLTVYFMIDKTDPSISITSPADGSTTSDSSITVGGTTSDTPSGIDSVTVNGNAATYDADAGTFSASNVALDCGPNTITALATDVAGRTNSDSIPVTRTCAPAHSYSVTFQAPIDGPSVLNRAKLGRVVPVKFTLTDNGTPVTTGSVTLDAFSVSCSISTLTDTVEVYAPGASFGTSAVYNAANGYWYYNLDTSSFTGIGCWTARIYVDGALAGYFLMNVAK
jgi:hypothetical protein